MSSVSVNDAPVTRDTSVAISHVRREKDARRTKDRTRSEWTVDGSDNRTGVYGVDEITWRSMFDGSVRNQWVHAMHHRSAIHLAMKILTGRQHVTSSQHAELGKSRRQHDLNDLQKIIKWLDSHSPFESDVASLRSLASDISANKDDDINCDNAEEIGYRIHASMDNQVFSDVKLRKKDRVKTLQELQPWVKFGKKTVYLDYTAYVVWSWPSAKICRVRTFQYEMCPVPAALFKDSFRNKTDESTLAKQLLVGVDPSAPRCRPVDHVIIDGGWLIHRLPWKQNVTFDVIVDQHCTYVQKLAHPDQCHVILTVSKIMSTHAVLNEKPTATYREQI